MDETTSPHQGFLRETSGNAVEPQNISVALVGTSFSRREDFTLSFRGQRGICLSYRHVDQKQMLRFAQHDSPFGCGLTPRCIPIQLNWWLDVMPKGAQCQRVAGAWGARACGAVLPMPAVQTTGLTKDYAAGFGRKSRRRALDHLDLRVE